MNKLEESVQVASVRGRYAAGAAAGIVREPGDQVASLQAEVGGDAIQCRQGRVTGGDVYRARLARDEGHDCLVRRGIGLGNVGLDGLVEGKRFYLVSPQGVAVASLRVIVHPSDVPDGAEVEDGVEATEDFLGRSLQSVRVHVVRRLPRSVHGLAQRDVNGALLSEVAFPCPGNGRERVGIVAVDLLADIDGPSLVDEAGTRPVLSDDYVELGPVIDDPERSLADRLALLGIGVVLRITAPANSIRNRGVEEGG